jgi:hypothetical protein
MANEFTTNVLAGVIADLPEPEAFLLNTFYRSVIEDPSEEIHFDIDKSKPRITPLVSPLVAGRVVQDRAYQTTTFKPAYAKDKRRFNPSAPLRRALGERIGGTLSPQERRDAQLRMSLEDQLQMLTRREELMAAEALRAGTVTVTGEGYDTVVLNFGRAAGNDVTLTGNDRWTITDPASDPLSDIETFASTVQTNGNYGVTHIVLEPSAWTALRSRLLARGELAMAIDFARGGQSNLETGPGTSAGNGQKSRYIGRLGTFEIWVYNDTYIDDAGATQSLLTAGETLFIAAGGIEGTRCYAAIQDEEAEYTASRYFAKSWLEKDPAVRWLLLQSAPLMVPFRPNCVGRLKVY